MVHKTGVKDQVLATNKNPACLETFLGTHIVDKNKNAPKKNVIKVPSKKAVVAPSSIIFDVKKQVLIKPLKHKVTKPKIWAMVRMIFIRT